MKKQIQIKSTINRKESKMNDNEIRNAILEFAYNKAKEAGIIEGGGGFNAHEVSKLEGFEGIEKI